MRLTRREALAAFAAAVPEKEEQWSARWDRAIVSAAADALGARFDTSNGLLLRRAGPEYRAHTGIRSAEVHPTRESLEYALVLLENSTLAQRAEAVIDRIIGLQENRPESECYGLWGYFLEEPPSKMPAPDWNQAAALGGTLLEIQLRHGQRLRGGLRDRVRDSIRHAALAVRVRDVPPAFTSAASQCIFLSLAAAEYLGDPDMEVFARDRLHRLAKAVDETGSFAEYNSPVGLQTTITALTRIRMVVKNEAALALAAKLHHRAWLHLSRHWHEPTAQLAGPHSRACSSDIGAAAWIQKALGGSIRLLTFDEISSANVPGEVGILDYHCPEDRVGPFIGFGTAREHRELFRAAPAEVRPVQGTTYLSPQFCLGSVNRGDFSAEARPLIAYWGDRERPARYLRARVLRDDHDFASALLYSVQQRDYVLGAVTFRCPGGDRHTALDPVKGDRLECSRLRLRFDLAGVPLNAPLLVNGCAADAGEFEPGTRIAVDVGYAWIWLRCVRAQCGDAGGPVTVAREAGLLTVSADLLNTRAGRHIPWPANAYAVFALRIEEPDSAAEKSIEDFDTGLARFPLVVRPAADSVEVGWWTRAGVLGLHIRTRGSDLDTMDRAFRDKLNGGPVPVMRLTDQRLT